LGDHKADYEADDLLALYSITGGVPKYVELLMNNGCTTLDRMVRFITKPDSPFLDEGRNMLIQEFGKQYGTYFSILGCMANGEVTQADIEARLGEKSLGGQLRLLEEKYELVQKKRPILSKQGSQAVRFEVKDLFLRFWFRYFDRYRSLIEIGNTKALAQIIKNDYPIYSGLVLERWFRQRMMESYRYANIGSWWVPKQGEPYEIDIVAVTLEGDVEAYEVKRQRKKYSPALLESKVAEMQKHLFKGKVIQTACLSLEDM
jgi:AAA+ ATPase superfamily predicted ATPase